MKIIAFGHQKRVGKDTAANFLAHHLALKHHLTTRKVGFADMLKDIAYELYDWAGMKDRLYYDDPDFEHHKNDLLVPLGKTVRQVWIELGNNIREVYADTWIDYALNHKADVLIISDLRYPNEMRKLYDLGAFLIRIERPSIVHTSDIADDALLGYQGWDATIVNNGSIRDFEQQIFEAVKGYLQL